jgi:tetratricopeptide (TPR) repeat protein
MGGLLNDLLIPDFLTSAAEVVATAAHEILVSSGGTTSPATNPETPSLNLPSTYQNNQATAVDFTLKESQTGNNANQTLQKRARFYGSFYSVFNSDYLKDFYSNYESQLDPTLVQSKNEMAEKAGRDWGVDFKPDNPFHYLMAIESKRKPELVEQGYKLVKEAKERTIIQLEVRKLALGRDLTPEEKLRTVYEVIEKDMGVQYKPTDNFLEGVATRQFDCDTESYIVLAVAREMGWPVRAVMAPEHMFIRWEVSGGESIDMDLRGKRKSDTDYIVWLGISLKAKKGVYLESLTDQQLVGVFLSLRGIAMYEQGRYWEAPVDFGQAIALDPLNLIALDGRANIYHQIGNFEEAEADLKKVGELDPGNVDAALLRAEWNVKNGGLEGAHEEFKKIYLLATGKEEGFSGPPDLNFGPPNLDTVDYIEKSARIFLGQGVKSSKEKDYFIAEKNFDRAKTLFFILSKSDPKFRVPYWLATLESGMAKYNFKDYAGAESNLNEATILFSTIPKSEQALLQEANLDAILFAGEAKYALGGTEKDLAHSYDKRGYAELIWAINLEGKNDSQGSMIMFQKALADYDRAISLNPNEAPFYTNRGWAKDKLGKHQEGIDDQNKALALNPNFIGAYDNRGIAELNLKNYSKALADFNQVIQLDPKGAVYAGYYFKRAVANYHLGRYKATLNDYQKGISLEGNKQEISEEAAQYRKLAESFLKVDKKPKAQ